MTIEKEWIPIMHLRTLRFLSSPLGTEALKKHHQWEDGIATAWIAM